MQDMIVKWEGIAEAYNKLFRQRRGGYWHNSIPLLVFLRGRAMPANVPYLATLEAGNVQSRLFTISHQVGPLAPETFSYKFSNLPPHIPLLFIKPAAPLGSSCNCSKLTGLFASTLACLKTSTSIFSVLANHCSSMRYGQESRSWRLSSQGFISHI